MKCPDCETSDCAFCLEAERLAARVKELEGALTKAVEWEAAGRASDAIGQAIWREVLDEALAALAAKEGA